MKDFYFLLNGDIIIDAIDYQADGYTQVQLDQTHLPAGINAGYYRWDGTLYQLDETIRLKSIEGLIETAVDEAILDAIERGLV